MEALSGFVLFMLLTCALGRWISDIPDSDRSEPVVASMPDADGKLNMYSLPTGQGDSHVIQCPDGSLSIMDFGRHHRDIDPKYWGRDELLQFLEGKLGLIRNIIVSHNHWDHYILLPETFEEGDLPNLRNMYITCEPVHLPDPMFEWVVRMGISENLRMFNDGDACGPNNVTCENIDICPGDHRITAKVLAANLGQNCIIGNKNMDSILFKLQWGNVSMMLSGDFEDETQDWDEDGPQRQVVNYYGPELEVTVYKVSHHGGSRLSNKPVFRDALKPKALITTANPFFEFRHPRCVVSDAFIRYVGTLCKPAVTNSSDPKYCGEPIDRSWSVPERLQSIYSCGGRVRGEIRTTYENEHAIYTTTPHTNTINLITFKTDGRLWGIKNNITAPFISSKAATALDKPEV